MRQNISQRDKKGLFVVIIQVVPKQRKRCLTNVGETGPSTIKAIVQETQSQKCCKQVPCRDTRSLGSLNFLKQKYEK
jgi:hypothetical protein